ncbi:MAG: histidine--tRNA ligase, partial [Cytophagales bacterium]
KNIDSIPADVGGIIVQLFRDDNLYLADKVIKFLVNESITRENRKEKIDRIFEQDSEFVKHFLEVELFDRVKRSFLGFIEEVRTRRHSNPSNILTPDISEKGLRYDLTVPFARYVVMNRHEITFPFKRYQIQPVWRADRPQKGRYREFYQCDADVVGTDSLLCEADIVMMITEIFSQLNIQDYTIKINHRGILSGLAEIGGAKENEASLFVAIDKLDKIGEEKVKEELRSRGFEEASIATLFQLLNFKGNTQQKIELLQSRFSNSDSGKKGLSDFQQVLELLHSYHYSPQHLEFDVSLARGLSYYTGCIFEVKINNVAIGSVSGGGRYDNLTGSFGLEGVSGIGISFGVDRLYDVLEELKLFPSEAMISSTVMIAHFDNETMRYGLQVAATLRSHGIATELYPDVSKIKKQMEYANKKLIPYVIVVGADEMRDSQLTFKRMHTGEQQKMRLEDIMFELKK